MSKMNQSRSGTTNTTTKSKSIMDLTVSSVDSSETDFEFDDEMDKLLQVVEGKLLWKAQFQHLLEFSEDILPSVLHDPMKWCHISIQDSLKHIGKTEEILQKMGNDTRLLEMQLEVWKGRQQSSISKSRMPYSAHLYKTAGDAFYFAFYQNREIPGEIRNRMEGLFEAQFGQRRLSRARFLLKLYLKQFTQIEDFLSLLPEIYKSEVLAGLISDYLNPTFRDDKGAVREKMNELLISPDYWENQICLILLAREDCLFKELILDCMVKYMITNSAETNSTRFPPLPTTSKQMILMDNSFADKTRHRLKLFLDADSDLLVSACLSTEHFPTPLLSVIVTGLDIISVKITDQRSKIFPDFRPPLFRDDDNKLSMSEKYLKFFRKMKQAPSLTSLWERVKNALRMNGREHLVNKDFWIELFGLLY